MRVGGPDRKVGEERVGTWTGPCWQGRPVLPLSRAGPPCSFFPLGRQMLSQGTWLTPWVLEAVASCHLQAPAEHSSSSWSGLQGRSGSLWIQMRPPSFWALSSPPFFWGLPFILGASIIFCLAESSLSFSGVPRSLLLESPPPPSCAVFPAAPPAGTRVPPGRACGCPESSGLQSIRHHSLNLSPRAPVRESARPAGTTSQCPVLMRSPEDAWNGQRKT